MGKKDNSSFDVTIGRFNGVETWEIDLLFRQVIKFIGLRKRWAL